MTMKRFGWKARERCFLVGLFVWSRCNMAGEFVRSYYLQKVFFVLFLGTNISMLTLCFNYCICFWLQRNNFQLLNLATDIYKESQPVHYLIYFKMHNIIIPLLGHSRPPLRVLLQLSGTLSQLSGQIHYAGPVQVGSIGIWQKKSFLFDQNSTYQILVRGTIE